MWAPCRKMPNIPTNFFLFSVHSFFCILFLGLFFFLTEAVASKFRLVVRGACIEWRVGDHEINNEIPNSRPKGPKVKKKMAPVTRQHRVVIIPDGHINILQPKDT